ncbi:MAG: MFS transporter [Lautropia sp.]
MQLLPAKLTTRLADLLAASPLRRPRFRTFYIGSSCTALGYTMQAATAAWLMATLTPSALMVALVQSASTAPFLLFGLIAGALADIVERRRIIIAMQLTLTITSALLGFITLTGVVTPLSLLLLTLVCGSAFTFYLPAQQSSINELVPRADLPRAVALGAVSFNVSRAIGPAIAGAITAWLSSGNALLVSAAFFVFMIFGAQSLKSADRSKPGAPETLFSGVQSGVRYARHSTGMRSLIILNASFSICASAVWALLPVIARDQLGLGAGGYGFLYGVFGAGAVVSALSIPNQLQKRSLNTVVRASIVVWTAATLLVAATRLAPIAAIGAFAAGAAWVGVLASLSAGTQSMAPAWVRARAVSINLLAAQSGLAIGSLLWGVLASWVDVRWAVATSAVAMLTLYAVNHRVYVELGDEADVTPFAHLPDLTLVVEPMPEDGPVVVQVEYRVQPEHRPAFLEAIQHVEATRRRNGASGWHVFRDIAEEGRFVERYVVASWAEYVRLRTRMTIADRKIQERVAELQQAGEPIRISRLIGVNPVPAHTGEPTRPGPPPEPPDLPASASAAVTPRAPGAAP